MSIVGGNCGAAADRRSHSQLFPTQLSLLHAPVVVAAVTYRRRCADPRPRDRCRGRPYQRVMAVLKVVVDW